MKGFNNTDGAHVFAGQSRRVRECLTDGDVLVARFVEFGQKVGQGAVEREPRLACFSHRHHQGAAERFRRAVDVGGAIERPVAKNLVIQQFAVPGEANLEAGDRLGHVLADQGTFSKLAQGREIVSTHAVVAGDQTRNHQHA